VLGENKSLFWAKASWSVGRKYVRVLGENKLGFWAKASWSVGRKYVRGLGENKLGFWAKASWSVGRKYVRGLGENKLGFLGESKLGCRAKTFPVLVTALMSFKEGHRNSQQGRKRPQNITFHVRPLRCHISLISTRHVTVMLK